MPSCVACGSTKGRVVRRLSEGIYRLPGAWDQWRCDECGAFSLLDAPRGDALSAYYPKTASERSAEVAATLPSGLSLRQWRARFDARVRSPLRFLPLRGIRRGIVLREGARHLDVGCHTGDFLALTRSLGMEVAGVELDPHAVKIARDRGLDVREGTLAQAAFLDASFDVITLNHVFEHLPDPGATMDECARILRPGGTLIIAMPDPRSLLATIYGDKWVHWDAPRHLHVYPPAALARLAASRGLVRRRTRHLGSWGYAIQSARRRRGGDYFAPYGWKGSRWMDRIMSVPLGAIALAGRSDEYEMWFEKPVTASPARASDASP